MLNLVKFFGGMIGIALKISKIYILVPVNDFSKRTNHLHESTELCMTLCNKSSCKID